MTLRVVRSNIGDAEIIQIVELEIGSMLNEVMPDTTPENVSAIKWLAAPYVNGDHSLNGAVQCFVVRTAKRLLVVDTCVGNDKTVPMLPEWHNQQTSFLETLSEIGIDRLAVTDVLCTHLHLDHVGWNTMQEGGQWTPTFPNAKYYFARPEYEFWQQKAQETAKRGESELSDQTFAVSFSESVQPIVDAGLVEFIDMDAELGDGLSVIPTPGHTQSHVSVVIESGAQRFMIAGDAFHHPCQVARPDWSMIFDYDRLQSTRTRKTLLAELVDTPTLVAGAHFCAPSFGTITKDEQGGYVFEPAGRSSAP